MLILPTASAPEGEEVFDRWGTKGLDHYARAGRQARVVPLAGREDAYREDLIEMLEGAGAAFFSGGDPAYLALVLTGTPFWSALREAMDTGLAYAGCSAGVACLGDVAPDSTRRSLDDDLWAPGLGMFPGTWFGPHWDAMDMYKPGFRAFMEASVPSGARLVAIDEDTAMVGDGRTWSVLGGGAVHVREVHMRESGVHLREGGTWTSYDSGTELELELMTQGV